MKRLALYLSTVIGARHHTMGAKHMEMMAGKFRKGRYLFCPNGSNMAMYARRSTWTA